MIEKSWWMVLLFYCVVSGGGGGSVFDVVYGDGFYLLQISIYIYNSIDWHFKIFFYLYYHSFNYTKLNNTFLSFNSY